MNFTKSYYLFTYLFVFVQMFVQMCVPVCTHRDQQSAYTLGVLLYNLVPIPLRESLSLSTWSCICSSKLEASKLQLLHHFAHLEDEVIGRIWSTQPVMCVLILNSVSQDYSKGSQQLSSVSAFFNTPPHFSIFTEPSGISKSTNCSKE